VFAVVWLLYVFSGCPLLLCAIKLVFVSSLRLDVTDGHEPRRREIFSSALLMSGGKVL
jgi:hypothetical protein